MIKNIKDEKELRLYLEGLAKKPKVLSINITLSNPPTQEELQKVIDKINELISNL